jgi:hypothetical protein
MIVLPDEMNAKKVFSRIERQRYGSDMKICHAGKAGRLK